MTESDRLRVVAGLRHKAAHPEERLPCALLQDQHCSVYAFRPAVCRKAHSLSAQACSSGAATLPQNLVLVVQCEALLAGTHQALQRHRLPADRMELSAALLAALASAPPSAG